MTNPQKRGTKAPPASRRLVLLKGDEQGEVLEVLAEYHGGEVSGKKLHQDLQALAEKHAEKWVAAEWLGPQGWTRFLWSQKR